MKTFEIVDSVEYVYRVCKPWKRQRIVFTMLDTDFEQAHAAAFFFSISVCAITASGVPGGTLVAMNRFSTLCG
jgi:hypothetical protein